MMALKMRLRINKIIKVFEYLIIFVFVSFSWLLAGCGGLGSVCAEEIRHCLMLECDFFAFSECLEKKVCGPPDEDE